MKAPSLAAPVVARQLQGWHVLAMFIAFFGVIMTVNAYFTYAALSTYTGTVANEPYRKGLAYNSRIAAEEQQNARGWRETLDVGRDGKLLLTITDRNGAPVRGLLVGTTVGRPSTDRQDHVAKLVEQTTGDYRADLGTLDDGSWIVTVEASDKADAAPVFRSRRRLWLKP